MSKSLKQMIREDLGLVNEAYITQPKKYDLPTELLSKKNKDDHQKLFAEVTDRLNKISTKLDTCNKENIDNLSSSFRSLKQDEISNINSAYLHALYFENISDMRSIITMDSLSFMRIERDFGNFDAWQKDFVACAMTSRNGWAVMVYNTMLKRYINITIDSDNINIPIGSFPIIVLDMHEHAYFRDYLSDIKSYVFGMMKEFNWNIIEERINKAERIAKII